MNDVVTRMTPEPPAVRSPITPMDMVQQALERGASLDIVERLMALHERYEVQQSRKAFDEAMSQAKAEIPVIGKNRTVDFTSQKGRTNYQYEDLGEIARVVSPILSRFGLSYRFRTSTKDKLVTVTCVISHRDGHSEENALVAAHDDSGNKNAIQQLGSAITYLQRLTLKAALGLAASVDDDANGASQKNDNRETVTAEQVAEIRERLTSTKSDEAKFLQVLKIPDLSDIFADKFEAVMTMIADTAQRRMEREKAAK